MEKPIKPIYPDVTDKKKYPKEEGKQFSDEKTPYIIDCRKFQKDMAKYEKDIELYEQLKLIKFVKVASEKLILKKYKIIKIK